MRAITANYSENWQQKKHKREKLGVEERPSKHKREIKGEKTFKPGRGKQGGGGEKKKRESTYAEKRGAQGKKAPNNVTPGDNEILGKKRKNCPNTKNAKGMFGWGAREKNKPLLRLKNEIVLGGNVKPSRSWRRTKDK